MLLYKMNERRNAAKQFAAYEKRLNAVKRNGGAGEIDSQVWLHFVVLCGIVLYYLG